MTGGLRLLVVVAIVAMVGCGSRSPAEVARNGKRLYEQRRFKSALKEFLLAAKLQPENATHWRNAGLCFMNEGRVDAAIEVFRKAVTIQDDYGEAHRGLGILYHFKGQNRLAARHVFRAKELGVEIKPELAAKLRPYRE